MSKECKGLYFRYRENYYVDAKKSIHINKEFKLLKRKSCTNEDCRYCHFYEDIDCVGIEDIIVNIEFPNKLVNGGVYKLVFVSLGIDWETGYCDDWTYKFEEVEKNV